MHFKFLCQKLFYQNLDKNLKVIYFRKTNNEIFYLAILETKVLKKHSDDS